MEDKLKMVQTLVEKDDELKTIGILRYKLITTDSNGVVNS